MNKLSLFVSMVFAAVLGGFVSIWGWNMLSEHELISTGSSKAQNLFLPTTTEKIQISGDRVDFRAAASVATPSVVSIKVKGSGLGTSAHSRMLEEMFKEFFGRDRRQDDRQERYLGSGSGVIVSPDGYIITNNHVIEDAKSIKVVLHDRTELDAKLIGTDPSTDLAVLKVEAKGLPAIVLGNSDQTVIGEWVLAIGNPFELTSTVTAGIVSAKARNIRILQNNDGYSVESFIQTDAAVNPGNSGGALVNIKGELIGINTAIATQTGSYSGYSFAVPVNLAQKVMRDLIQFGTVQRAVLGVRIQDLTPETVTASGMTSFRGVYVVYVGDESTAKEAGIVVGDVILALNDTAVNTTSELQEFVARKRPGDKITITYFRGGQKYNKSATLKNKMNASDRIAGGSLFVPELGAELTPITNEERGKYGTKHGVKVTKISKGALKSAGVPEGFIITHIDKQEMNSPEDAVSVLSGKTGGVLLEGFSPEGTRLYFAFGL
jgi:Do/DeqQ family serine protease